MKKCILAAGLLATPVLMIVAGTAGAQQRLHATAQSTQAKRLTEADRKVTAGRILLKWAGYVEKINGQNRRAWAASLWPSLARADLDNLQKASRAVTYEGMRNALLGQKPDDDQIIDTLARSSTKIGTSDNPVTKALGSRAADLVFTPVTPCRIVDTRNIGGRIGVNATRDLNASNVRGDFTAQGGSDTNCGIPSDPAALALSVTALGNLTTGYLRVYPHNGTSTQGSPIPLTTVNTTATNDIIVPACQDCIQELKVFSTASTHYAVFVTGFFMAPVATPLESMTTSKSQSIAHGATNLITHSCPAGYTLTGGGCWDDSYGLLFTVSNSVSYSGPIDVQACMFKNTSGAPRTGIARARCVRVPGR